MHELHQTEFYRAAALFDTLSDLHGSVCAVLGGFAAGKVWIDSTVQPTTALLEGPEGLYLGGRPDAVHDHRALTALIPGWAYLYAAPAWHPALPAILPHTHFQHHERILMHWAATATIEPVLPTGFSLERDAGNAPGVSVVHSGEIVAHCRSDLQVNDYVEVGVWTRPDLRRRGLATAALAACQRLAVQSGVARMGWHCHASNVGSIAVAKRAGFTPMARYAAWSASLPAENRGDLSADTCRSLAMAFQAGRGDIGWLDFHAAVAWAEAGERDRALGAVERLVAGNWPGRPEWLADHWALVGLRGDPRFEQALAVQVRK